MVPSWVGGFAFLVKIRVLHAASAREASAERAELIMDVSWVLREEVCDATLPSRTTPRDTSVLRAASSIELAEMMAELRALDIMARMAVRAAFERAIPALSLKRRRYSSIAF